ncbi:hypothetical protein HYW74_03580 [Candidatus Pacearchaeota archaeon]|nr:hypothetical protein [Candidatus Pacearchaeota archaeon]
MASLYVGIDESNHGRYPEFFAAALSEYAFEGQIISLNDKGKLLNKVHNRDVSLEQLAKENHHSFLILNEGVVRSQREKTLGVICASLLLEEINSDINEIFINIDGEHQKQELYYVKAFVSHIAKISIRKIYIESGKKLDQRCPIVNRADMLAYVFSVNYKDNKHYILNFPRRKHLLRYLLSKD